MARISPGYVRTCTQRQGGSLVVSPVAVPIPLSAINIRKAILEGRYCPPEGQYRGLHRDWLL